VFKFLNRACVSHGS